MKLIVYLQSFYIHTRPVTPGIAQQIMPNSYTHVSLDASTVICLTATKYEPFMFSVLGFALAYTLNIHIIMILNDFCLFPAYFGYVIVNVRQLQP